MILLLFEIRMYWHNTHSWSLCVYTPLIALALRKDFDLIDKCGIGTTVWIGFIPRIPMQEHDKIYRFNWNHEFSFTPYEAV